MARRMGIDTHERVPSKYMTCSGSRYRLSRVRGKAMCSRPFSCQRSALGPALALLMSTAPTSDRVASSTLSAQVPQYRARVELVQVPVVVRDRTGQHVADLTLEEFELFVERRRTAIATFSRVAIPDPLQTGHNGQVSTRAISKDCDAVRAFVLLFDDFHVSPARAAVAQDIGTRLIQRWIGPGDVIAVGQASSVTGLKWLSEQHSAIEEVRKFVGRRQAGLSQAEEVDRIVRITAALATVGQAIDSTRCRRVAMVLLIEGIEYDVFNVGGLQTMSVVSSMEKAIDALRQSNVVLYAIDPRGLASTEGDVVERGGGGSDVSAPVPQALIEGRARLSLSRLNLRHLAEETGGFASLNSNRFTAALEQIGTDSGNYYLVGFYPDEEKCDRTFMRLRIKARRPGLRVTARSGYFCARVGQVHHPGSERR